MDEIEKKILQYVAEASNKISFGEIKRHLKRNAHLSTTEVKTIVLKLIRSGTLCYTSHFGCSFLDVSYDHPVKVSENILVKPSFYPYRAKSGEVVLSLDKGASFGSGEHPSTRMAIRLIDFVFSDHLWRIKKRNLNVLDIGTGSGVLGILSAKLGAGCICGIDTDPCSVFEAKRNVFENGVENCMKILSGNLKVVSGAYNIVLANLRAPTLNTMRDTLEKKLTKNALLIFSGLKEEEAEKLFQRYKKSGFLLFKQLHEKGWAAVCLLRGDLIIKKPQDTL